MVMQETAETSLRAGWYDDPENAALLRYWDGAQWTDHRSPRPVAEIEKDPGVFKSIGRITFWSSVFVAIGASVFVVGAFIAVSLETLSWGHFLQEPGHDGAKRFVLAMLITGLLFMIPSAVLSIRGTVLGLRHKVRAGCTITNIFIVIVIVNAVLFTLSLL